jgi:hypothetical protein
MPSLPPHDPDHRHKTGTSYLHIEHVPVSEKTAWVKAAAAQQMKVGEWARKVLNAAIKKHDDGHA